MVQEFLVCMLVPAVLVAAAGWDLASFTIPNFLQVVLVAGFAILALASHMALGPLGWHLLAAAIGFAIGFALFAFNLVGGGDAKLFASVALWLGFPNVLPYAVIASLFGGALTLILLGFRHFPLPALLARHGWLTRLHDPKAGIPYGVALASGAFVVLYYSGAFQAGTIG